jgi:D-serine deaminase-like pyridoxal phosphate-dependent protein
MSEEHGWVDVSKVGRSFKIGERLHIIPNHVCPTVNEHDIAYGIAGDSVEAVWRVEGRGKLQ